MLVDFLRRWLVCWWWLTHLFYSPGVPRVCDDWYLRDGSLIYLFTRCPSCLWLLVSSWWLPCLYYPAGVSRVCDDCSPAYGFLVYFIHQVSLVFVMIGLPMMASLFILFTRCPSCLWCSVSSWWLPRLFYLPGVPRVNDDWSPHGGFLFFNRCP